MSSVARAVNPQLERRRSPHLLRDVPLIVRGESAEHSVFREETFTISISNHGALMLLSNQVAAGQRLVLVNPATSGTIECRVARLGPPYGGLAQVGIEFADPAPWFWTGPSAPDPGAGGPTAVS